jgi:phospholipid N-methyltransferase
MMTKEQVLQNCTIEGNVIKLPNEQLDRKLYQEVAKSLELIGGKWKGGKVYGFVFSFDPTDLLKEIANGENRNLKKEFQFFATPDDLANELVFQAQIEPNHKILEPSAGQGAIIKAIQRVFENKQPVDYCETMDINLTFLQKISNTKPVGTDFLKSDNMNYYDRIIANPPFSKNQDIQHIYKMYECLKPGGRIVTIASKHWQKSNNKTETQFRNWLKEVKADIEEIPSGTFKESGTMISSCIIIINKV